uniref:Uncharacterized protein n=1 Tax=Megaselia scalaris TaxID=36166 RepID=T1GHV2_MEGSC
MENKKQYDKQRKKANTYKLNDVVAILRMQIGSGLKLNLKYLGPYKTTKLPKLEATRDQMQFYLLQIL